MERWTIEWHYKLAKQQPVRFVSDDLTLEQVLPLLNDIERTGRVASIAIRDEREQTWTKKMLMKWLKEREEYPHTVEAFFDGGYSHETGEGGAGVVVYYEQNGQRHRYRSNETLPFVNNNNEAEYAALLYLLATFEQLDIEKQTVTIYGDAQGVLKQLAGEWPCYEPLHEQYLAKIEEKMASLKLLGNWQVISRKDNAEADQLATQALEGVAVDSHWSDEK